MTDNATSEGKLLLGHATIDQARKWPKWKEYESSAAEVTHIIKAQGEAKDAVRAHIKSDLLKKQKVSSDAMVDFQRIGDIVNIYQVPGRKQRRKRSSENLF
jgi:hypothetical protein